MGNAQFPKICKYMHATPTVTAAKRAGHPNWKGKPCKGKSHKPQLGVQGTMSEVLGVFGMEFATSDLIKNCNNQYLTAPTRLVVMETIFDQDINVSVLPTGLMIRLDL